MTLKAVAGGQINNAKMLTDEAAPKNKTAQSAFNPTATVPLTADKQFGANFLGNLNRARLEQKFAAQQPQQNPPVQNDENKEILGVNTKRPFPKAIAPDETQESVLRRTFQEYAATAGISKEKAEGVDKSPAEMFVEERMEANKAENNGEYRIFNSKTGAAYTDKEWVDFQKSGGITMYPTEVDIDSLKSFKSVSDTNFGQKIAGEVLEAMKEGADSPRLARSLETMRAYQNNADFQSGLVDRLGADKFLELHAMVKDDLTYRAVLQQTLSGATSLEAEYGEGVEHGLSVGQQIARRADVETLAQLTSSESYPMSKDFLVEAGKKVVRENVGWQTETESIKMDDNALTIDKVAKGTNNVLAAINSSPAAASELLQSPEFVKNVLKIGNMDNSESSRIVAQMIQNGTSKEAREKNADGVEKSLLTIAEVLNTPEQIKANTVKNSLNVDGRILSSKELAAALVNVYQNNIESFSKAAGHSDSHKDSFDGEDVRRFIGVIQPYYAEKDPQSGVTLGDKMAAATAIRYNDLLGKAEETGKLQYAEEAANLAGTFINGNSRANVESAKEKNARQEKFAKAIAIVGEVATLNLIKGINEIVADVAGKIIAASSEDAAKGNYADNAVEENRNALNKQQETNKVALVQIYEQANYDRVSGKRTATADELKNAKQFLGDLKTYNDSLSSDAKILNPNGRLINSARMNGRQTASLEDIFGEGSNNPAQGRLYERMNLTRDKLRIGTQEQIK